MKLFMTFDFSKIQGPKKSVQENFEQLVCQLLMEELNAISINGKGGDGGIDCFTVDHSGQLDIFQVKYFLNTLNSGQKQQIKKSLNTACRTENLKKWILIIPHDHTPTEKKWFEALTNNDLELEWWGETKLRILLSKYPNISKQFFQDDLIIEEFSKLKLEISNLYNAFGKSAKINYKDDFNDNDNLINYFNRANEISQIIKSDLPILTNKNIPLIAIDVYDISYYIGIDTRFNIDLSISDFCFENSPIPFTVLNPSIIELHDLIRSLGSLIKYQFHNIKSKSIINEKTLGNFLSAYKTHPESELTRSLYNDIASPYLNGFSAANGLNKLSALIKSKKLEFAEEKDFSKESVENILEIIRACFIDRKIPVHRLNAMYTDALNLAFLNECWNKSKDSIRMISSARLFKNLLIYYLEMKHQSELCFSLVMFYIHHY
ncbi:MAG: hypothetical protein IPH98_06555 [Saprospiraceae bacterium]|nr:hypothetical protein [Candidatus Defluviibacterium haderslevense]